MTLTHPYTACTVAQAFMDTVFRLHGFPESIVSDRDPIFLNKFWQELMACQGIQLKLSSAYHPQTDGQIEVVNRCLETYLRCMCSNTPQLWPNWISLAEWWHNTTFHTAINATPYEIVYGQPPPASLPYLPGESNVELLDRSLTKREEMLKVLKFHLKRAQNRMQQMANKHRIDRQFQVGDLVYLKLHSYKQISVTNRTNEKLPPKFFGPFPVLEKVGPVAYKLQLPNTSQIHNVFHVSQLKKHIGDAVISTVLPSHITDATNAREPEAILDRTFVKKRGQAVTKVLVKWKKQCVEDATWELYYDLLRKFPQFFNS
uniref:Retrotransposable element Tf2 n=2 Tax=Cajanus cajan TaxID=3821 RepID=A0A151RFL5_CAJCA|nr:Retrotransposable element Tf2 [Cajanus cajan]